MSNKHCPKDSAKRLSLNKGVALGTLRFKSEIEELAGRRVIEGKRGRPVVYKQAKM